VRGFDGGGCCAAMRLFIRLTERPGKVSIYHNE
jgi:hypothetical protein